MCNCAYLTQTSNTEHQQQHMHIPQWSAPYDCVRWFAFVQEQNKCCHLGQTSIFRLTFTLDFFFCFL